MRTLKYAILGLINRHDMTGYDITKEFSQGLSNFWNAKHSQIYPELKKLTDEGLVSFEIVIAGDVLEKKLYSITEKGQHELKKWLLRDDPIEPTPKDKFRLRMYFSDEISHAQQVALLHQQLEKRLVKHSFLEEHFKTYIKRPNAGSAAFGDYIVLEGALLRESAYIQWIRKVLGYLETERATARQALKTEP